MGPTGAERFIMYQTIDFSIRGMAPLLVHNGQLADPLNPIAIRMREISGKRKKTDTDHIELGRLEFLGGLYLDDGKPCIPGINIEAMLTDAGRKLRMGDAIKAGVISDGNWPIIYDGPKNPDKMWEAGKFHDRRGVKLNGKVTVIRTRPIFHSWALDFSVSFLPDVINKKQVVDLVSLAGQRVGLGDFVPRYGRFEMN
jgi:hypothetical protein